MPIYRPSELKQRLRNLNAVPKKKLSQNFLLDGNIIKKIIKLGEVSSNDFILEIGSGPGALTEALLNTGATVFAVEKDRIFAEALTQLEQEGLRLKVFCEDIMTLNLDKALSPYTFGKPIKVIANLPYHLTTPIITHLVPQHRLFSTLVIMVQEEVARRFVSKPGSKMYGSITVFLNFYSTSEYAFRVSKNCFYPRPNVESALVKFTLHVPSNSVDEKEFFGLTRNAFGHRRKMIHNSLEEVYDSKTVQEALMRIGKSQHVRAEELSLEDFLNLYKQLKKAN
ncbi:MAG TPA: 16S rRNA (adenine(1518)-N(6)/adenine(1519)-N(6))-dimethyltransferase RsmA [Waddliaceae bacterium]